nr:GspH/FimT family pseudopilin [uncultured Roseateles sp.]
MRAPPNQAGLTLTELVFAILVLAILAAVALPSYNSFLDRQRVKAAAQALADDLRFAREESVRLGRSVHVTFQPGPPWCWGVAFNQACDCKGANPALRCDISRGGAEDFKGVSLTASQAIEFDPQLGRAVQPGRTEFTSQGGTRLRVELTGSGRSRACVAGGSVSGLEPC